MSKLRKENLKEGSILCLKNAKSLLEDAELLIKKKSYGHAKFLIISAIEETNKAFLLASPITNYQEIRKDIREHGKKIFPFILFRFAKSNDKYLANLTTEILHKESSIKNEFISSITEFSKSMNQATEETYESRMRGLYVDYESERWISPFDISKKDVSELFKLAKEYFEYFHKLCNAIFSAQQDQVRSAYAVACNIQASVVEYLFENKIISKEVYETIKSNIKEDAEKIQEIK
ncbi:MAG: AbiV family abortive infection protein [archaeon]|nr:AbiV family abortive infection protein [archaeon]